MREDADGSNKIPMREKFVVCSARALESYLRRRVEPRTHLRVEAQGKTKRGHAMRTFIMVAISAIALSSASLGQANAGAAAGAAGVRDAADGLRITQPVARVCREVCRGNFCKTQCFHEHDRDEVVVHERVYRDRDHDERRDRRPGVELRVPGVSIETR
jgi:hypothetical protein